MDSRQSEYAVQISRFFLQPLGLWDTLNYSSKLNRLLHFLQIINVYFLLLFAIVPTVLRVLFEEKNLEMKIKLIGPLNFAVTSVIKHALIFRNNLEITKCYQQIEMDWQNTCYVEKKVMQEKVKTCRSLVIFTAIVTYTGSLLYHFFIPLAAISESLSKNPRRTVDFLNITGDEHVKLPRILSYPVYSGFINLENNIIFATVYILQYFSLFICDTIIVATCSLAATFVSHIYAQLDIIMILIKNYIDGDVDKDGIPFPKGAISRKERLAIIVQRHIKTLNKKDLVSLSSYIMLLASYTMTIFIYCYIGETLTSKCTQVGSIYNIIRWYDLPGKSASEIMFIVSISRYPAKLTAGKFIDLTLATFCTVLKSAFTYFNLLRTSIT
ncbi:uncharacterized protein LOC106636190 [Copidosoma floridanum]|uniref:uncharacterized protein LOC106636190 n=1 Tax=Copidosoma floridanum TaxID=29053 RepID=UPI0006C9708D|nr:uncharacterized protein LOC106636190 [Copidosoma floridanum]